MGRKEHDRLEERSLSGRILLLGLALSLLLHILVLLALGRIQSESPAARSQSVEVAIYEPPPPPEPAPEPPPAPPDFRTPREVEEPAPVLPAANRDDVEESDVETGEIEPVFGLTEESVTEEASEDDAGMEARVGSTLMKEPEAEFTDPQDVRPYHQPEKAPFVPADIVEVTSMPSVRRQVVPDYPPELRARELEGTVMVEADIDAEGKVVAARLQRGTGLDFDAAALEAVKATVYRPARRGDEPVPVRIVVPVRFRLR